MSFSGDFGNNSPSFHFCNFQITLTAFGYFENFRNEPWGYYSQITLKLMLLLLLIELTLLSSPKFDNEVLAPTGIVAEMIKAAGEEGIKLVGELAMGIFCGRRIPKDWKESFSKASLL